MCVCVCACVGGWERSRAWSQDERGNFTSKFTAMLKVQ